MLLKLIEVGIDFLSKNPVLVGAVIAAVEFIKKALEKYPWFKGWHKLIASFLMAFIFVIPAFPPKFSWELVAQVVAVGGAASGLFAAGSSLAAKVNEPKK